MVGNDRSMTLRVGGGGGGGALGVVVSPFRNHRYYQLRASDKMDGDDDGNGRRKLCQCVDIESEEMIVVDSSFAQDWLLMALSWRSAAFHRKRILWPPRRPLLVAAAPPAVGWEVISS